MKPNFFSWININFTSKVLLSVVGLLVLSNVTMNLFYLHTQHNTVTEETDKDGRLLANILANNAKLGIFARESHQLAATLQAVFAVDGIIGGCVYDKDGDLLDKEAKRGWNRKNICRLPDPLIAQLSSTGSVSKVLRIEREKTIEFWNPVIAGPKEFTEETLFFSHSVVPPPAKQRTIGFVGIVFDKVPIKKHIQGILLKNISILLLFLIFGLIAAYYIIQGVSKPLNTMITNLKEQGLKMEARDELGVLADTYSGMIKTIGESFRTINELKKGLETKIDQLKLEIDKRKKIEIDLRESEDKFRTISENIADGVAIIVNNKFAWHNKTFISIFGHENTHRLKLDPEILLPHPKQEEAPPHGTHKTSRYLVDARKKDGTALLLEVGAQNITYERKASTQVIIRDITELAAAEKKRKELEVKALSQSKLASLGKIATSVAHEINQPLSFIKIAFESCLQDIENKALNQKEMKTTCTESLHQVARITLITDHLRNFGRTDPTQLSGVSITETLTNSLTLMRERLRLSDIELIQEIGGKLSHIYGNSVKLEQVFINLFQNSIDVLADSAEKKIMITMRQNGPMVEIEFSDSGPGITPDVRKAIFEPFFTTKRLKDRTGLGLGIVNNIIREHKGTIKYQQKEGWGASFLISLPTQ